MRRFINLFIAISVLLSAILTTAYAQDSIAVTRNEYEYQFRENITFYLEAHSTSEIEEVTFHHRIADAAGSTRQDADFIPGKAVAAKFIKDTFRQYIPPGTEIEYWWTITDKVENQVETTAQVMEYDDNTHDWREISANKLILRWYEGDERFAQELFDYGMIALERLKTDTGAELDRAAKIYIYATHPELLDAMSAATRDWTGGAAYPKYGVILSHAQPRDLKWGRDVVAHELTHLVIHRLTDNPYGRIPLWLDEGLAMYVMTEGNGLEGEYKQALRRAVRDDALQSLRALSGQFPADDDLAALAYAQSQSVVEFILAEHGKEKMNALLEVFSRGAHYDDALSEVLGVDTDGLEAQWRIYIGADSRPELPKVPTPQSRPASQINSRSSRAFVYPCCCVGLMPGAFLVALFYLLRR